MPAVKRAPSRRVDDTRDRLVVHATDLFVEKGFADTSLDDITAEAHVTKGALYHHFPGGKQALFHEVFHRVDVRMEEQVTAALPADGGAWALVHAGLDAFLDACTEPVTARIMFEEGPVGLGWAAWRDPSDCDCRGLLSTALEALAAEGHMDPPTPLLVNLLFLALGEAGTAVALAEDTAQARAEARQLLLGLLSGLTR